MRVIENEKDKSFLLIKDDGTKYAVSLMTDEEFEEALYNTEDDWKYFLRSSQDYYEV